MNSYGIWKYAFDLKISMQAPIVGLLWKVWKILVPLLFLTAEVCISLRKFLLISRARMFGSLENKGFVPTAFFFHFKTWQWLIIKHCKQRCIIILAVGICQRFCFRISTIICALHWTMSDCSTSLQSLLALLSSLCLLCYLYFLSSLATFVK